jgi:hypothetical protein
MGIHELYVFNLHMPLCCGVISLWKIYTRSILTRMTIKETVKEYNKKSGTFEIRSA